MKNTADPHGPAAVKILKAMRAKIKPNLIWLLSYSFYFLNIALPEIVPAR